MRVHALLLLTSFAPRRRFLAMTLKAARTAAGLTQAELAAKVGCDQTLISKIESGRVTDPSHRLVVRISRVLFMEPSQITEFKVRS